MDGTSFPYQSGCAAGLAPLAEGEVRLWCVGLRAIPEALQLFSGILSRDEAERAERFRFPEHRDQYITARGLLRLFLSRLSGIAPQSLQFDYGLHGKPALSNAEIAFNVSHSGDLALYAFAHSGELGVDIEQYRELSDMEDIARRFFAKAEVKDLLSLPENEREAAFFRCWTRKESFVKAVGDGLYIPLHSFRVTLRPDQPATIVEGPEEKISRWKLADVTPQPDYAAALMTEGSLRKITAFRAPDCADVLRLIDP